MTYDNWKTREDERWAYGKEEPPCVERPDYDENDVCQHCGANPTQACQFNKERERP